MTGPKRGSQKDLYRMEIQLQSSRSLLSFWLILMILTQCGLGLESFLKMCGDFLLRNCFHHSELLCAWPQPEETKNVNQFQSLYKDLLPMQAVRERRVSWKEVAKHPFFWEVNFAVIGNGRRGIAVLHQHLSTRAGVLLLIQRGLLSVKQSGPADLCQDPSTSYHLWLL